MKPNHTSFTRQSKLRDHIARPGRPFARVSVVIPTLNEAANLPHVLARIPFVDCEVIARRRPLDRRHGRGRACVLPDVRVVLAARPRQGQRPARAASPPPAATSS